MGRLAAAALLLALCACGRGQPAAEKTPAADAPGVTLSADEAAHLGIATAPAQAAQYRRLMTGYGVVTALDAIAQTDADVRTAQAAAAQSRAAAGRARLLGAGDEAAVSREVVESAQSKAAADQAALSLARQKTSAAFGRAAPWQDAASRQAIMARLTSGRSVLVRASFPLGALGAGRPAGLQIARLGNDAQSWTAQTVWDAPADAAVPGRSFYALVDGSDLAQNERVTVLAPVGAAVAGVRVPASALVFGESETWVYVQSAPGHFLRTRIDISRPQGDGYFIAGGAGLRPGDKIVVSGSGLLLAHETNPSTEAGE